MEWGSRFDTALIERVAEPIAERICSFLDRRSCLDLAMGSLWASCSSAVLLGGLTILAFRESILTSYVLVFCLAMVWLSISDSLTLMHAIRPFARRAREGEVSWSLPPFRVRFIWVRLSNWLCIAVLPLLPISMPLPAISGFDVAFMGVSSSILLCKQVGHYFAACRPRPPGSRRSTVSRWADRTVSA